MLNTVIRIKNKMIYFIYYYYYLYKYSQLLIICFLLSLWIISIYFINHNINIFFVVAQGPFETNSIAEFALKQNNKNLNVPNNVNWVECKSWLTEFLKYNPSFIERHWDMPLNDWLLTRGKIFNVSWVYSDNIATPENWKWAVVDSHGTLISKRELVFGRVNIVVNDKIMEVEYPLSKLIAKMDDLEKYETYCKHVGHWYFTHASIPFKITGSDIFDNNSRLVLTSAMKNAHVEEFNLLLEQPGQLFNPGLVKDQYASELINETANVDTMDIFFQIKPHDIFHRDEFIEGLNNYLQFKLKDIPIIGNELFVPYAKDWCNNCIINTQLELKPIIQNGAVKVISKCCKFK